MRVRAGKVDEALQMARELQQRHPKSPAGWMLEGEIQGAQQRRPQAIAAQRTAHQRGDSTETAMALHRALARGGQTWPAHVSSATPGWPRIRRTSASSATSAPSRWPRKTTPRPKPGFAGSSNWRPTTRTR
ncbi:MAG: hypothetical protein MZW92_21115 [Comamonadaceae bacterium]|nr:hypothetical protein [Comamonadaceae bacterium]